MMIADTLPADLLGLDIFRAMQSLADSLTISSFLNAASLYWPDHLSPFPPSIKMVYMCRGGGDVQERNERGAAVKMPI